jgi:tRNA pseudouridine65 synthase
MIDHPIPRAPGEDRVPARTEVWRREIFGRYALVEARLHTGRLHQIRRHLKHISCPLIGDVRYGKGEHNRIFRTEHALHRLALHCTRLVVAHPDGAELAVEAPLPADLAAALASCRQRYAS